MNFFFSKRMHTFCAIQYVTIIIIIIIIIININNLCQHESIPWGVELYRPATSFPAQASQTKARLKTNYKSSTEHKKKKYYIIK